MHLSASCRYDTATALNTAFPARLSSSSLMVMRLSPLRVRLCCGAPTTRPVTVSSSGRAGRLAKSAKHLNTCIWRSDTGIASSRTVQG